jgi:hypothetical protein
MTEEHAVILSHISNSAIIQLPGRRFPAVAIQGDTLSRLFSAARYLLGEAKRQNAEETYFEILMIAMELQGQLTHYEEVLQAQGLDLPYRQSVKETLVSHEWGKTGQ